jgi:hypothetical protein
MTDIFNKGKYLLRGPTRGKITKGEDVLRLAEEMERRFNAFHLAYVFEALEDFLSAVYGKMLYQLRDQITIRDKKSFHKANKGSSRHEGTLPYFEQYAKWTCKRDCGKALADFSKRLEWDRAVVQAVGGLSWGDFIAMLGLCRHTIVHDEGRVSESQLAALSKPQAAFIRSCQHETLYGSEKLILPETRLADDCFESVVSYARGLYVLLADYCGMSDDTKYFKRE